jgi:hypothetical protein
MNPGTGALKKREYLHTRYTNQNISFPPSMVKMYIAGYTNVLSISRSKKLPTLTS